MANTNPVEPMVEETLNPAPATDGIELTEEQAATLETEMEIHKQEAADLEGKDMSQLLEIFSNLIEKEPIQEIRIKVDFIKNAFYRQLNAMGEAKRKAFIEANGPDAEYIPEESELSIRMKELMKLYRTKRDEHMAQLEQLKEENYQKKLAIIEELKKLIDSDEAINSTFNRFRELQAQWKEAGQVPQQHVKDIWETYNLHVENFYDYIKINKELRDLDWKKNLEAKSALCEAAERLKENPSIVAAFNSLQKMHEQWREIGPVAKEFKDELWTRFHDASTIINKAYQDYFEERKATLMKNLELKKELCQKAEELISEELTSHKAWTKASEKLISLQQQWKTIGFAPKGDNTAIYDRFRHACDKFFERKRKFYSEVKEEMSENLRLKQALCEKAEELAKSEDWKKATDAIIALQAEWKKVGTVSQRASDAVWKRFRSACDDFFERKSKFFAEQEQALTDNLAKKQALIDEILGSVDKGTREGIREFQQRWSEIGHVPYRNMDEIQKRYKKAMDELFRQMRSNRGEHIDSFRKRISSMKESADKKLRSERDKLYLKVRQLESEISTLENNIGFFKGSKSAQSLIAEVERKIEKARADMAEAIEKVRIIDSEE